MIRSQSSNRTGYGERVEIGRIRKASRTAVNPIERFDPEGCKNPEGEWRLEARPEKLAEENATGQKRGSCGNWGKPGTVVEQKGRTGRGLG
jgi:hypothetical protein